MRDPGRSSQDLSARGMPKNADFSEHLQGRVALQLLFDVEGLVEATGGKSTAAALPACSGRTSSRSTSQHADQNDALGI